MYYAEIMCTFHHGFECITQVTRHITVKYTLDRVETTCLLQDCDRHCVLYGTCMLKTDPSVFHPSRMTGVRLWAVITLQSLW